MNNIIRFAVVGCGHIGKRHAAMILANKASELVALVDVRSKVECNIEELSQIPFYNSLKACLQASIEIDVVCIATPNGLHYTMAKEVLEAKKHVVIEKPMALKKTNAENLVKLADKVGRHIFTVMQNRYSPPSVWLKEIVSNGTLGKVNMVQVNCYWNRDERYYIDESWHGDKNLDGGTLFTQFSHFVDMMYWLFGDIKNIQARMHDFNHQELTDFEDTGIISFDFTKGGMGVMSFSTSCWDKNFESSLTIIAENGTVKVGGQYMDTLEYCHIKNYEMPRLSKSNPPNNYGHYKGSAANHSYVFQNIIDVLNNDKSITTTAFEGAEVVGIIERMYKSL